MILARRKKNEVELFEGSEKCDGFTDFVFDKPLIFDKVVT